MKYERSLKRERNEIEVGNATCALEYTARMRAAMSDTSYALPEASLRLPFDDALFERSRALATKLATPRLAYILLIGIGGSNLGAKAVYEATSGTLDPHTPFAPKMLFADTCTPELLGGIAEILLEELTHPEELIVIVASKSGATTETVMNASILIPALEAKLGALTDRVVCITDENSPLWKAAVEQGFHALPVPRQVGGRYSVFSPAGVFPLLCAGVDAKALLRGAQMAIDNCVERGTESDAYTLAEDILAWHRGGARIVDLFLFHPELESVGKWYRQLFAESLGKNTTREGEVLEHRMVPTVSLGSIDLHSAEQMHLAYGAFTARILTRAHMPHWEHEFLANDTRFTPLVPAITRRAPCEILDAIYQGVKEAYGTESVPFGEIVMSDLEPESLGKLLQFHMCMVMHLGNLLNLNAFDQPNVEIYKQRTRRILGEK